MKTLVPLTPAKARVALAILEQAYAYYMPETLVGAAPRPVGEDLFAYFAAS
ncbi:hypothetical protein ACFMPD_11730 [Sedimentitalea sp. HM32M-2]|uniref:hypothetical protein n=1 Tax=Sedimentitalea sp. HM32M-2 TaxID=3351566 RepID=UPI00363B5544